jgi:arylformamidase
MLIDITWPIAVDALVHPDDLPAARLTRLSSMAAGAEYNLTRMDITLHTGTHLDAPRHFIADGAAIDELPVERFCVACQVIDLGDAPSVQPEHLRGLSVSHGEAVLFKTRNALLARERMAESWVYISKAAAQHCAVLGLGIVGLDYIEVESPDDAEHFPVHLTLLGAGVLLLENLDLRAVRPGRYRLMCLPIKVTGAEGAPCRAVLETIP